MADDFFDKVSAHLGDPNRRKYELNWFRKRIREASSASERTRKNVKGHTDRERRKLRIGQMYFFTYNAKYKKEMPYYDRFPLILPFNQVRGGFMGINVHYLPPAIRFELFNDLKSIASKGFTSESRFQQVSWQKLTMASRDRYIKPSVKRYIGRRVLTPFIEIHGDEWHIAAAIDIANFRKANKTSVWADSIG